MLLVWVTCVCLLNCRLSVSCRANLSIIVGWFLKVLSAVDDNVKGVLVVGAVVGSGIVLGGLCW